MAKEFIIRKGFKSKANGEVTGSLHITENLITTGEITGSSITKSGGISTEFLKADGTIDSTTYANADQILHALSTGLKQGGLLSVNADNTKYDITSGSGFIIDNHTDVDTPVITDISWTDLNLNSPTNILTHPVTYVSIDTSNNIIETVSPPDCTGRRNYIYLGTVVHSDNTIINLVNNQPTVAIDVGAQLQDLMHTIGFRSISGNELSANASGLEIKKAIGTAFKPGANFQIDNTRPHKFTLAEQSPVTFRYRNQDSTEGSDVTLIDPTTWDDGGTTTTIAVPIYASIQRVYIFPSGAIRIQRGQAVYSTFSDALDKASSESFVVEDNISENGLYLGSLVIRKSTTDLSNTDESVFILSAGISNVGATSNISTLQQVYDISYVPQIVTSTANGALTIKEGTNDDTADSFVIRNFTGTDTVNIPGSGDITGSSFTTSTGLSTEFLKADGTVDNSDYLILGDLGTSVTYDISTTIADDATTTPTTKAVYDAITAAGGYDDEQAQDAVGTILTNTTTVNFTYTDATPTIEADVIPGGIDITQLSGYSSINQYTDSDNLSYLNTLDVVSGSVQIDITQTTGYSSINQYTDADNLIYLNSLDIVSGSYVSELPTGIVSGSIQINHDATTNYVADEHFLQSEISITESQISNLTHFTVSDLPSGTVSSSIQIDVEQTTNYSNIDQYNDSDNLTYLNTLDIVSGSYVSSLPSGTVSSSIQIDHDQTTNYDSSEHFTEASISITENQISDLAHYTTADLPSGTVSGSAQIDVSQTTGELPSNRISGTIIADSVEYTNVLNKPTLVSGSLQVDHDQTTNFTAAEHFLQSEISITESQISNLTHYTDTDTLSYINSQNVVSGSIPNSLLDNSSLTIGTTTISLGGTSTTLTGLTSVTSTSFVGSLTGNADTATSWSTSRTVTFATGDVTGNFSIDGSTDVSNVVLTVADDSHIHDGRYYTESESDAKYLLNTTDILSGNLTITGNLTIQGTTTTINSSVVQIDDNFIEVNVNPATTNGGIYVRDLVGTASTGSMAYDVTNNIWKAGIKDAEVEISLLGHTHAYDNYGGWALYTDTTSRGTIAAAEIIDYIGGTGISIAYTTTNSNTLTFNHSNSVTADTVEGTTTSTLTHGGTFTVPTVNYDAQGHITGWSTNTLTLPSDNNTTDFNIQANSGTVVNISATENVNFINGNATTAVVVSQVNPTVTFNHNDTSTQTDITPSARTYVDGITLDTYGHIQTISTSVETVTQYTDSDTLSYINLLDIVSGSSQIDVEQTTNYSNIDQYNDSDNLTYLNTLDIVSGSITTNNLAIRYKSISALAASAADWTLGQVYTKTLAANTTLTFSNVYVGVKDFEISGDYTLALPSWVRIKFGTYDGTVLNHIQVTCTNSGSGTEAGWAGIDVEAV